MIEMNVSSDEIGRLASDAKNAAIYFQNPTSIANSNETWGVAGNTFRAFGGYRSPSEHYRKWAVAMSEKLVKTDIMNALAFSDVHALIVRDIAEHWSAVRSLELYKLYKLVDLFLFRMAKFAPLDQHKRTLIQMEGHPALDTHTFTGLARIVPGLAIGNLTMSAVKSESQYFALQAVIRQITKLAKIPNLYFDIWCWPPDRRRRLGI